MLVRLVSLCLLTTCVIQFAIAGSQSRQTESNIVTASADVPQKQVPQSDKLKLGCAQILQMTSAQWIAKFNQEKDPSPQGTLRAIAVFSQCYDARTDHLEASLVKTVGGPLLTASGNFRVFDQALNDFMAKALAASDPPADELKSAYAALYEKQFRYEFYRSYSRKNSQQSPPTPEELDEVGNAKNRFGQELDSLPADKMRELHAAFSKLFDAPYSDSMRLRVYRFAIFVLEPPSAKPFSPPPF